jgi:hypothetical protein
MTDSYETYEQLEQQSKFISKIDKITGYISMRSPYSSNLNWLIKEYLDIFRVHSKRNIWLTIPISMFWCAIFLAIFQKPFLRFYRYLCGPNERALNSKPLENLDDNHWYRKFFELFTFTFGLLSLVIMIPYARIQDSSSFLCFWAYCSVTFFSSLSMSKNRTVRRFIMKYVFFISIGAR